MRCFLDCDGCLVDFVKGASQVHGIQNFYENHPEHHGQWDFDVLAGIPKTRFWGAFDMSFWSGLDWMPEGKELLSFIESKFGQHNICILTSPAETNYAECVTGKRAWIERHIPQYKKQVFIGSYKEGLAHDNAILVDDYDKNCERFVAAGGHAFLIPQLWNARHMYASQSLTYTRQHLARK